MTRWTWTTTTASWPRCLADPVLEGTCGVRLSRLEKVWARMVRLSFSHTTTNSTPFFAFFVPVRSRLLDYKFTDVA